MRALSELAVRGGYRIVRSNAGRDRALQTRALAPQIMLEVLHFVLGSHNVRSSSQPPASEQHSAADAHPGHESCRQWNRYELSNAEGKNGSCSERYDGEPECR